MLIKYFSVFQTQYAKNAVLMSYVERLPVMLRSTPCLGLMPLRYHVRSMDYKHRSIFRIAGEVLQNAGEYNLL